MPLEGLEVAFHEPGPTYVPPLTSSLPSRPLAQTLAVDTARFLSPPGGPPAEPQGCWALWHLVYLPQAVPETRRPREQAFKETLRGGIWSDIRLGQEAVEGGRRSVGTVLDSKEPRPRQAKNSLP